MGVILTRIGARQFASRVAFDRKDRTFIHSKASAELNQGVWKVEQPDFSPTAIVHGVSKMVSLF